MSSDIKLTQTEYRGIVNTIRRQLDGSNMSNAVDLQMDFISGKTSGLSQGRREPMAVYTKRVEKLHLRAFGQQAGETVNRQHLTIVLLRGLAQPRIRSNFSYQHPELLRTSDVESVVRELQLLEVAAKNEEKFEQSRSQNNYVGSNNNRQTKKKNNSNNQKNAKINEYVKTEERNERQFNSKDGYTSTSNFNNDEYRYKNNSRRKNQRLFKGYVKNNNNKDRHNNLKLVQGNMKPRMYQS